MLPWFLHWNYVSVLSWCMTLNNIINAFVAVRIVKPNKSKFDYLEEIDSINAVLVQLKLERKVERKRGPFL
jgi:hypothetical protein